MTSTLHKLVFLDVHCLYHLGLLSIEWNLMILGSPAHGNVTINCTLNSAKGMGVSGIDGCVIIWDNILSV